jgi:predicted Rossmann fold flavoprotein
MPSTIIGKVSHAPDPGRPYDLVVVGGGAAGMHCAALAGQRGLSVALIDHAAKRGEKIRISGGGRCNFTNADGAQLDRYSGAGAAFIRPTLRAYPPERFIEQVRNHGIRYHEKHKGQLFCDESAEDIVEMLAETCRRGRVREYRPCRVHAVRVCEDLSGQRFAIDTDVGELRARRLVVATGGLSIPKIGASDLGYRIARQFGHRVVEPRPALVPLTFDPVGWAPWQALAGVSLPVAMRCGESPIFDDDLLFTHRGLSGPALLQVSTFWRPGSELEVDLGSRGRLEDWLRAERDLAGARQLSTVLAQRLPRRLALHWLAEKQSSGIESQRKLAELGNPAIARIAGSLEHWRINPAGTEGFRKAEVTSGGVSTAEIEPRTLESRRQPGLHFVGEVLDVTGWLGGYNFQWAWASAYAVAVASASATGVGKRLLKTRSATADASAPD